MGMSIIYFFSNILLIILFLLIKKSDKKQNIILWIFLSVMLVFCYNVIVAYIYNFIYIKITLGSMFVINLFVCFIMSINLYITKRRQSYFVRKQDVISTIIIILTALLIGFFRFGKDVEIIYETCDPGTHFWTSMEFFRHSTLLNHADTAIDFSTRVFGSYVNAGLLFKVAYPFVGYINLYIVYIVFDVFMLAISGLLFYFLISYLCKKTNFILIFLGSILYLLGYPLNNMIFGFFYSGHTVTLIATLILVINLIKFEKLNNNFGLFLIMMINICICFTYYLFAPIVVLSLIMYFIYRNKKKENKFFNKKIIIEIFITCVIPFLLCISYFVIPYLGEKQYSIFYQLTLDGYFYNSGISNFILFFPFIIYYMYLNFKNKKFDYESFVTFILFFIIVLLVVLIIFDYAVPYYLSKFSYILWLICFLITFKLFETGKLNKGIIISFTVVFCGLAVNSMFNLEKKFIHKNKDLWNMRETTNLMDVYSFNFDKIQKGSLQLNKGEIDIIRYLYSIGAKNVVNNKVPAYLHQKLWLNAFFWTDKSYCNENELFNCLVNEEKKFFDPLEDNSYGKIPSDYNYFMILYKDISDMRYINYNALIPFEIFRRWDKTFNASPIVNRKELYDKISRDSCINCKFVDFDDGIVIIKENK